MKIRILLVFVLGILGPSAVKARDAFVSENGSDDSFALVSSKGAAPLHVSSGDYPGVLKIAKHLQTDLEKVTGISPKLQVDAKVKGKRLVIIGTLGKNALIDSLAAEGKIDAVKVEGKWETFGIQTVDKPIPGVGEALVIFGSDKRGTIFGIYELSREIGVSPWYWWADVPVQKKSELHVLSGFHSMGEPKVKYRGIFINDEAPALTNWSQETFGGFNSEFYEKVYELILRNRGNYLWPAMWHPAKFYVDDPENARLADEMGVVIATTHHEPMGRAHAEWWSERDGPWNYNTNEAKLKEYWRGGVERLGDYESVVTLGMRGDGDHAMSEGTAVELLERIAADQRDIIADVTGKPAEETPQVWAIYKEVQDYYDKGMRLPEDVTVLLCDDNWGNLRVLPKKEDLNDKGGFGIYYHFDYVGGPVSYRWINVSQIERTWEQMNLAYEWGVDKIWLVNVGDIKPMELPISFFLDFAWDPDAIGAEDLPGYYVDWATQQFGSEHAEEIADILALQTKYAARRTPEMMKADTYSLTNYRESERVIGEYRELLERAKTVYDALPEEQKAAFYQLALFPAEAVCNLNEMYVAVGKNQAYSKQGRSAANFYADKAKMHFEKDAELTRYYHEELMGGKWNHMMSQPKIGYTSWNSPQLNVMPSVNYVQTPAGSGLGYAPEYSPPAFKMYYGRVEYQNEMPLFDSINEQSYYFEVINNGSDPYNFKLDAREDWIRFSESEGTVELEEKVYVSIDWEQVPAGETVGAFTVSGAGSSATISVPVLKHSMEVAGFVENEGVVSIAAERFERSVGNDDVYWSVVPNLGRTGSSVIAEPANAEVQALANNSPHLEYTFTVFEAGEVSVDSYLSPTLNYKQGEGLLFAVSIDDEEPRIVNMNKDEDKPDWKYPEWWNKSVGDHIKVRRSQHSVLEPGVHTLKVWMIDPGIVFQKFVIDAGGLKPSYLGPPSSDYVEK